ncbi:restriction endonuclease subunit S [Pseudomonas sp. SWRI92]|uniref:restriction endonuclease subunit S n=1 Tax=Pseudomonas sp. SWRI92 TaxID=2745499 RepID=UPI00164657C9|nr:restriction endonuclease subunit S [Pseudomonas sp. SWRI92]MBC3377200.1 restriction endonuclease subunit S [Pseudomonas sp. SWRI92]
MSFPAYPAYKTSGVKWLGDIPIDWVLSKVKYDSYVKARVGWHGLKSDEFTDVGPYLVTGSDFKNRTVEWASCYHCTSERFEQDKYIQLEEGDLLITKDGTIGKLILVEGLPGKATLNSGIFVIRPLQQKYSTRFYFWIMQSSVFHDFIGLNKTGSTIIHLYQETFENLPYALPALTEQTHIARFLDHETTRIDALILEQQRLIELLKEKRQALISHAVTKGLDSTVPLKDSGGEWLGAVPAHWVVMQLSRVLEKVEQGWSPNASNEPAGPNEWGVIKISAIKNGVFFDSENKALLEDTQPEPAFEIKNGDVLITRANTPNLVGDACIVRNDSGSRLMLSDLVYRLRLLPSIDASFICYFLLSHVGRAQIKSDARGSSMSMAKISQGHIKAWLLALPTYSEQVEISKFISEKLCKLDELIRVGTESHTLLAERRSALISAAVTGKIDVRGWQPPACSPTPELAQEAV